MTDTVTENLPPVICIMGPTASGKTALAMELCDHLPADIISVDSALIYKGFDIGSAKPTKDELAKYPHRIPHRPRDCTKRQPTRRRPHGGERGDERDKSRHFRCLPPPPDAPASDEA